eukprot:3581267-Alexandrium_andersonii.AAC.1
MVILGWAVNRFCVVRRWFDAWRALGAVSRTRHWRSQGWRRPRRRRGRAGRCVGRRGAAEGPVGSTPRPARSRAPPASGSMHR